MSTDPNQPPPPEFIQALQAFQKASEGNNTEQMEAAALNAMAMAVQEAQKNPTPQMLLKQEAVECEARGDWQAAESCYRRILPLEEATGNALLISKAHQDLSRFFFLLDDLDRAEASAKSATASARLADNSTMLCVMLENDVHCALRRSNLALALELASEAVAIIESGPVSANLRSRACVTRAQCRLANGDVAGAESDLLQTRPDLIDKATSPVFAGVHSRVAKWWEVTADLRTYKGDHVGARGAWTEAVKSRRHVASLPQVAGPYTLAALARTLLRFSKALNAAGDPSGAENASAEAQRIWSEIDLPNLPAA
jgi:tetratricopeptide (TPR) repeat protein